MTALAPRELAPELPPAAVVRVPAAARGWLRPGLVVAALFVLLICVVAVFPGRFAANPDAINPLIALQGPGRAHLLGTDQLGRDTFARVIYGARSSLALGLGATGLAAGAGTIWGLLAGLGGRVVDEAAMRLADIFMSLPSTLMALLVIAVLGASGRNVAIAIAVSVSPGFARVVRVQTLVVRQAAYVQAATVLGIGRARLIARHIAPNVLPPVMVLTTAGIGQSIIAGASLSFLGLGPQPPVPEWGSMLSQARDYLQDDWALAVFPGLAITLTVISIAVLGREIQSRFEGRGAR